MMSIKSEMPHVQRWWQYKTVPLMRQVFSLSEMNTMTSQLSSACRALYFQYLLEKTLQAFGLMCPSHAPFPC